MRFKPTKPDVLATSYGIKKPNIFFAALCFVLAFLALAPAIGLFGWEADAPPWAGALIGIGLVIGGVGLLTYRSCFVLDKQRGVLTRWRGLFGLHWNHAIPVADLKQVILRCERRVKPAGRRSNNYIAYPICIESQDQALKYTDELERDTAHETARHVAETLGMPLVDLSETVVHKDEWF